MDCYKIFGRLAEIRRETKRCEDAIGNGNSTSCYLSMDLIEAHIRAIRAELNDVKGKR